MATLKGKTIVVLGGTSGIGLATARSALDAGASVVVSSSSEERVKRAVMELGAGATGEVVDLTNENDTRALFERVGALDHLVFTAGESLTLGKLTDLALASVRKAFDLRVFGAMAAVKHAAPRIRSGGSVVLTLGVAKDRPTAGWTVGATICGAMDALTRALAIELAPLRVNAVSPGFVRTPLWSPIPEADRETMYRDAGARLPVRRVGTPEDIAQAYLYLLQNDFTTGHTMVVDGGHVLV